MTDTCTEVSDLCPVSATVLGYYPNLGINAFFSAGFGACFVGLLVLGGWKRTWGYTAALAAGAGLEMAGYVARVMLHYNPWNQNAFETQICAIILAPTLICISVYLTLKHITLSVNPELSRIKPKLYPAFFVPADVSCLILQAIGGGLAASAGSGDVEDQDLLRTGDNVIIAGIALQCVVLGFFGVMSVDYFRRVKKAVRSEGGAASQRMLDCWNDKKLRIFCYAVATAYCGILIRCIYRIAEMAGGWGNYIMQDEPSFIVLEGFMILIPTTILTIFTPGIFFRDMAERESRRRFLGIGKKKGPAPIDMEYEEKSAAATTQPTTAGGSSSSDGGDAEAGLGAGGVVEPSATK